MVSDISQHTNAKNNEIHGGIYMKKALTSVLFVTIVLCLFSCSDAIPSNDSENDSYYAVRVGTTDGDYFKEDENFIQNGQSYVDETAKKTHHFKLNDEVFALEYIRTDFAEFNERRYYRCLASDEELYVRFFEDSEKIAWLYVPSRLLDAPYTFQNEAEFRKWTMQCLANMGVTDLSKYREHCFTEMRYGVITEGFSFERYEGFCFPKDSSEEVSRYIYIYELELDGVATTDRYVFYFRPEEKSMSAIFFPNADFSQSESCPLDMEKADKALDDYVNAYLNTSIYKLDSYDVTQKMLTIINGELACEYELSVELTRDGWDSTRTTLLSVAVFPNVPEEAE